MTGIERLVPEPVQIIGSGVRSRRSAHGVLTVPFMVVVVACGHSGGACSRRHVNGRLSLLGENESRYDGCNW